ncbi:MAG TPA: DnaJ domain-containing protein [Thermoanaerobaculia bacterium]|nr:DnaJ domain-containing protein [Thermoanaerobaculia bacterium]
MKVNYYEVLGVDRSASEAEIRERFRRLARENHPDRYQGPDKSDAERKFQALTEAMNVLTNPERRKQHDAELASGVSKGTADFTQVAKVYLSKGVKAFKEGDLQAAYENFDMAVKHNPQDAKAHHYLALTAARMPSMMRQAVQAAEAAVQRDPVNPVYLKDAGVLCRKAGLNAKAERYLEQALRWDPENVEAKAALAELRQAGKESKDAGKGFTLFRKS